MFTLSQFGDQQQPSLHPQPCSTFPGHIHYSQGMCLASVCSQEIRLQAPKLFNNRTSHLQPFLATVWPFGASTQQRTDCKRDDLSFTITVASFTCDVVTVQECGSIARLLDALTCRGRRRWRRQTGPASFHA